MNFNRRTASFIIAAAMVLTAALSATAGLVTFQVNMGPQIQRGTFDPQTDTVLVAGDAINGWSTSASPLANSVSNTNVWLDTFEVAGDAGTTVQYKFIFNSAQKGVVWEGNVGGGGAQNRSFTLSGTDQTLPAVYFNNVTNAGVVTTPVTFQVNLGAQIAQGNFDPASGTVSVAGDALNNWSTTASVLTNSPTATNVWLGTFPVTEAPGSTIAYKFVMNGSTWESRANRTFTLSNATETLPLVFFNDMAGFGLLSWTAVANGQITLSWTGGLNARLQSTTNLTQSAWEDVPNSAGQTNHVVTLTAPATFFRLTAP